MLRLSLLMTLLAASMFGQDLGYTLPVVSAPPSASETSSSSSAVTSDDLKNLKAWIDTAKEGAVTPAPTQSESKTFYAAGATMLPQTRPQPTGWAIIATEINTNNKIYSFSETDYTMVKGNVISSARTGLATPLRSFGGITIYGLGDAGVATGGSVASAAYSGGGFVLIPVKQTGWNVIIGVRVLKTSIGGTQTYAELGIGKR